MRGPSSTPTSCCPTSIQTSDPYHNVWRIARIHRQGGEHTTCSWQMSQIFITRPSNLQRCVTFARCPRKRHGNGLWRLYTLISHSNLIIKADFFTLLNSLPHFLIYDVIEWFRTVSCARKLSILNYQRNKLMWITISDKNVSSSIKKCHTKQNVL